MAERFTLGSLDLPWRVWDGASVVFDPLTGDTHRLNAPSGYVLQALSRTPDVRGMSVDDLIACHASSDVELTDWERAVELLQALEVIRAI